MAMAWVAREYGLRGRVLGDVMVARLASEFDLGARAAEASGLLLVT